MSPALNSAERSSFAHSDMPLFHIVLFTIALLVSIVVYLAGATADKLVTAVLVSAICCFVTVLIDVMVLCRGAGVIGRLLLGSGCLFWFWIEAVEIALGNPQFVSPEPLYRGIMGRIPDDIIAIGLICVNLFSLAAVLSWSFAPVPTGTVKHLSGRLDPQSSTTVDAICFLLACLAWTPFLYAYSGDISAALGDMLRMRGAKTGPWQDPGFLHHLYLMGFMGGVVAVARIALGIPGSNILRWTAAGLLLFLAFFSGGTRFHIAFLIAPAALVFVVRSKSLTLSPQTRVRRFSLIVVALVALVLYQGGVRTTGLGGAQSDKVQLQEAIKNGYIGYNHFTAMLFAVHIAEERGGFFHDSMVPIFLTHYIPRALWPDKPQLESWSTYNSLVTQGHTFNVTPSVTGQYYMNWGFPGVFFIGILLGWLARCAEAWFRGLVLERQMLSASVGGMAFAFIFLSFRFFHPLYFAYPLFAYIAYLLFARADIGVDRSARGPAAMTSSVARRAAADLEDLQKAP